ncbi:MAG: LysE family translocator [Pseudomonadales bacterium]
MDALLALAAFTFVASITPGPNNLMLAASGVGFGFRRTLPHMVGVCVGFALLVLICGLGVGALITGNPAAATALKVVGSGYLLYLAWMLRGNFSSGSGGAGGQPMSFSAAVVFQFANPKAWLMGVTGASAFLPGIGNDWIALAIFCAVICAVNLPCITSWAVLGSAIRSRLNDPRWQRPFSGMMVLLTLYAAVAVWL